MELLLQHGATAGGPRDDYWPLELAVQRCTAAGEPSSASARTAAGASSSASVRTAAGAPSSASARTAGGAPSSASTRTAAGAPSSASARTAAGEPSSAALAAQAAAAADAAEYPLGFPVWNDECREWCEEPPSSQPPDVQSDSERTQEEREWAHAAAMRYAADKERIIAAARRLRV